MPLATNEERGIKAAATQVFPQVTHVLGWNHILQDIKRFAKLHNYTVSDLRDTVHNLMLKKSEAEYLNSLIIHTELA